MTTMLELSDEVIGRAVPLAVEMGLPLDALLSYLLEGWTNPKSRLRRAAPSPIVRKVGLTRAKTEGGAA